MSRTHQPIWRSAALPAAALCLTLAALTGCSSGSSDPAGHKSAGTASTASGSDAGKSTATGTQTDTKPDTGQPAPPAQVSIPSIGVTSALLQLGLNADHTVQVPPADKGMTAGWYTGSATPGEPGAAVLIGHNDTRYGRAVFHDLRKIHKGADIAVRNKLGKTAHFTVTSTQSVSKKAFPTDKVYGRTTARALRLITCDGSFDAQGHPVNNLIVYATLR
ncbi:class F sortase [Streptomyces sp. SID10853]|uniref:class F sortase n=1 Tax=Streptomyces sp. SID10853 TaxID=2706028 RepID=UPI0013C061C9|nr:class F sortase [Streptomyces sp. SID10853]NDZ83601.1 class F sortase [Streptomyces sp. SID10853]